MLRQQLVHVSFITLSYRSTVEALLADDFVLRISLYYGQVIWSQRNQKCYVLYLLRGCLTKNHPLNLAQKIILLETLATERLYQGENKSRFVLIRNDFLVALGAI